MESTLQSWTQHYAAELLPQRDQPEWSSSLRKQAWEIYLDLPEPPPPQRSLRKVPELALDQLQAPEDVSGVDETLRQRVDGWGQLAGAYLESNTTALSAELQPELAEQGVILCSLADALATHPELVRKYLGKIYPAITGKALALNLAYWRGGSFLYLPKGVQLELPVYLLQHSSGAHQALFSRSVVVAEANSSLTLIVDAFSDSPEASLVSDVVELFVGDNAELRALYLQQQGREVHSRNWSQAQLGRDARYYALNVGTGARYHEVQSAVSMEHKGAEALLLGLFLGNGEQHFRQNSLQNHLSPHTVSNLQYHTVLRDQAYSFFNGMIYVDPKAQQTESGQLSKNLLLSDSARADAIPNLEILADDVQSGHGAAVGSLDKEQAFYLMSRGFDRSTAEAMLVEAFMESVILRFPDARVQQKVEEHLALRLLEAAEVLEEEEADTAGSVEA